MASSEFEFATAGRIIFGLGSAGMLAGVLADFGQRPFVITGGPPDRTASFLPTLTGTGLIAGAFPVAEESSIAVVEQALAAARNHQADVVVSVGGGSVIDTGKAVAALARNSGPITDYLEVIGKAFPLARAPLPFAAVPTTAASGMDALTQLIEAYVSRRANPWTDALCRGQIRRRPLKPPLIWQLPWLMRCQRLACAPSALVPLPSRNWPGEPRSRAAARLTRSP